MHHVQTPDELTTILMDTLELRQAYLVGGCVRDALLGVPNMDFDVEVFGVGYERLVAALGRWGRTDLVGRSFGVVKLTTGSGVEFDFTIPRRDSKVGAGHKGFEITLDPTITPREAAARRDFTINSVAWNPRTGEFLDFFGGEADLRRRILRHTSDAFVEDPLRVMRGMQFAGRFDMTLAPETAALCRRMIRAFSELAPERVREEWFKWAAKSSRPSAGLALLMESGWIDHFPEIRALAGCPQDPEWHPEGDVFVHTGHCCDAMATLPEWRDADRDTRVVLMLAVLAHDFGKPVTTHSVERAGNTRIVSPGHEEAGGPIAVEFLERINAPIAIRERVVPLVTNHLAHLHATSDRAVRRLARRVAPETIDHLCTVIAADHAGRPPLSSDLPENVMALRAKAAALRVEDAAPKPILLGRHLIALGLSPGVEFGRMLSAAFDAQIDGCFDDVDGGLRWMREWLRNGLAPSCLKHPVDRSDAPSAAADESPGGTSIDDSPDNA